jgi:hypothetical protein
MVFPNWIKKILMFPILIVVILILFSLIDPMKIMTDIPREAMNCPNTISFNQTAWGELNDNHHLMYSTACLALNADVLAFIGILLIAAIIGWWK